uniref:Uncharacterized protein n=1 Tax=Moniliophthora roreri TaxID=221103 RepID=A0A0W0EWV3_MONRR
MTDSGSMILRWRLLTPTSCRTKSGYVAMYGAYLAHQLLYTKLVLLLMGHTFSIRKPCERRRTIQVDYTSKNEQFVLFVLETDCERRQNQRAEACAQANPNRLSKPRYKSNSPALSPALSPAV